MKYILSKSKNVLYRDRKFGRNCPSHAAQLPVLNGRKCSATFHESSNISFNISYLVYYYNLISKACIPTLHS